MRVLYAVAIAALWTSDANAGPLIPIVIAAVGLTGVTAAVAAIGLEVAIPLGGTFLIRHCRKR